MASPARTRATAVTFADGRTVTISDVEDALALIEACIGTGEARARSPIFLRFGGQVDIVEEGRTGRYENVARRVLELAFLP